MTDIPMYYLARRSCGCAVSYISAENDTDDKRKLIARRTGEWHRAGYSVDHVTADELERDWPPACTHKRMKLIFE